MRQHSITGCVEYQMPEMLESAPWYGGSGGGFEEEEGYDAQACDVWASGVILCFMLCGFLPFAGKSDSETARAVKRGIPRLAPHLSQEVCHLIKFILAKEPHRRATIADIIADPWFNEGGNLRVEALFPEEYLPEESVEEEDKNDVSRDGSLVNIPHTPVTGPRMAQSFTSPNVHLSGSLPSSHLLDVPSMEFSPPSSPATADKYGTFGTHPHANLNRLKASPSDPLMRESVERHKLDTGSATHHMVDRAKLRQAFDTLDCVSSKSLGYMDIRWIVMENMNRDVLQTSSQDLYRIMRFLGANPGEEERFSISSSRFCEAYLPLLLSTTSRARESGRVLRKQLDWLSASTLKEILSPQILSTEMIASLSKFGPLERLLQLVTPLRAIPTRLVVSLQQIFYQIQDERGMLGREELRKTLCEMKSEHDSKVSQKLNEFAVDSPPVGCVTDMSCEFVCGTPEMYTEKGDTGEETEKLISEFIQHFSANPEIRNYITFAEFVMGVTAPIHVPNAISSNGASTDPLASINTQTTNQHKITTDANLPSRRQSSVSGHGASGVPSVFSLTSLTRRLPALAHLETTLQIQEYGHRGLTLAGTPEFLRTKLLKLHRMRYCTGFRERGRHTVCSASFSKESLMPDSPPVETSFNQTEKIRSRTETGVEPLETESTTELPPLPEKWESLLLPTHTDFLYLQPLQGHHEPYLKGLYYSNGTDVRAFLRQQLHLFALSDQKTGLNAKTVQRSSVSHSSGKLSGTLANVVKSHTHAHRLSLSTLCHLGQSHQTNKGTHYAHKPSSLQLGLLSQPRGVSSRKGSPVSTQAEGHFDAETNVHLREIQSPTISLNSESIPSSPTPCKASEGFVDGAMQKKNGELQSSRSPSVESATLTKTLLNDHESNHLMDHQEKAAHPPNDNKIPSSEKRPSHLVNATNPTFPHSPKPKPFYSPPSLSPSSSLPPPEIQQPDTPTPSKLETSQREYKTGNLIASAPLPCEGAESPLSYPTIYKPHTEIPFSKPNPTECLISKFTEIPISQSKSTEIPISKPNPTEIPVSQSDPTEILISKSNIIEIPISKSNTEIPISKPNTTEIPISKSNNTEFPAPKPHPHPHSDLGSLFAPTCVVTLALLPSTAGYTKVIPSRIRGPTLGYHRAVQILTALTQQERDQAVRDTQVVDDPEWV